MEELKIRIHDHEKIESSLKQKGAVFTEELQVTDTYLLQPKGEVLKITEDNKGDFLVHLKSSEGRFQILKYEKIYNKQELKQVSTCTEPHGFNGDGLTWCVWSETAMWAAMAVGSFTLTFFEENSYG